uniref:Putative ovule protein n=1 Tax=Solanum chacoense TaxID=4108 RepID=A0A0V0GZ35_SOLCH
MYSVHPSITKMYCDLRQHYWWSQMKPHVMEFVVKCQNSQEVNMSISNQETPFNRCPSLSGTGRE